MKRALLPLVILVGCGGAPSPGPTVVPVGSAKAPPVPASAPAPSVAVRWALPSCPLRYEILSSERFETEGMSNRNELVAFTTVDAKPASQELELRITPTVAIKHGKHRPFAVPDASYPPIRVTTDGARVRPVEASTIFAGLGTHGGLAWLFPDLGADGKPWELPFETAVLNPNGVSFLNAQVVSARAPGKTVSFPLRREISSSPEGVLVRAKGPETWSSRSGPDDMAVLERTGEIRTEHLVAPNGRLLRARLERDVAVTFTVEKHAPMHSRFVQRSEAHLVSACDGPTASRLEPALTREERAIAAVGALAVALATEPRPTTLLDAFTPELRRARTDRGLLATIDGYRARETTGWPIPLFVKDDDVVTKGERVEVASLASVKSPKYANTRTPSTFHFDLVERDGKFLVDGITAAFDIEPGKAPVFELTKTRSFP